MLIAKQKVRIKWSHRNKKYYQNKGYVFTKYGDYFDVKLDDVSPGTEVDVKAICDFCHKEYDVKLGHYLRYAKNNDLVACNDCRTKKRHFSTLKSRQEALYNKALDACSKKGYIIISKKEDIINNTTYVDYLCPIHKKQKIRISNLINGKGCPRCAIADSSEKYKLSSDEVERRIKKCGGVLLNKNDYKNRYEKNLFIRCPNCNNPFQTSLVIFTQHGGQLCDNCYSSESVGEKRIKSFLENNHIKFISQKWFDDCRDIKPLPFDFYLPDYNVIIEFDGRQHFEETDFFTYSLKIVQKHDAIKNQYCIDNNIKLIRIPYWDINKIEQILDSELILHKDIV